jgi:hypothetical protein
MQPIRWPATPPQRLAMILSQHPSIPSAQTMLSITLALVGSDPL